MRITLPHCQNPRETETLSLSVYGVPCQIASLFTSIRRWTVDVLYRRAKASRWHEQNTRFPRRSSLPAKCQIKKGFLFLKKTIFLSKRKRFLSTRKHASLLIHRARLLNFTHNACELSQGARARSPPPTYKSAETWPVLNPSQCIIIACSSRPQLRQNPYLDCSLSSVHPSHDKSIPPRPKPSQTLNLKSPLLF